LVTPSSTNPRSVICLDRIERLDETAAYVTANGRKSTILRVQPRADAALPQGSRAEFIRQPLTLLRIRKRPKGPFHLLAQGFSPLAIGEQSPARVAGGLAAT
jgi:hypothetical protein